MRLPGACDASFTNVEGLRGEVFHSSRVVLGGSQTSGSLTVRKHKDGRVANVAADEEVEQLTLVEKDEDFPSLRPEEFQADEEFSDAFQRLSRMHRVCCRTYTGPSHFKLPLFQCYTCAGELVLCAHCRQEHIGFQCHVSLEPVAEHGYCDCMCSTTK